MTSSCIVNRFSECIVFITFFPFRVEIDCRNIFQPGQLGVAMSRAKTSAGLRVKYFQQKFCISHSQKVNLFMQEKCEELREDKSCCQKHDRYASLYCIYKSRFLYTTTQNSSVLITFLLFSIFDICHYCKHDV